MPSFPVRYSLHLAFGCQPWETKQIAEGLQVDQCPRRCPFSGEYGEPKIADFPVTLGFSEAEMAGWGGEKGEEEWWNR